MLWADRALIVSPIVYALCTSEKQFKKYLKKIGITDGNPFLLNGANATVHFFEVDGDHHAIVCIGDASEVSEIQANMLLVHESVHIWQRIKELMGEDSPSAEFEAYAIQRISQNLIYAYKDLKGKE